MNKVWRFTRTQLKCIDVTFVNSQDLVDYSQRAARCSEIVVGYVAVGERKK